MTDDKKQPKPLRRVTKVKVKPRHNVARRLLALTILVAVIGFFATRPEVGHIAHLVIAAWNGDLS